MNLESQLAVIEKHLVDVIKSEFEKVRVQNSSDNLAFKDEILTEIKTNRQETAVVSGYRSLIADHESRIIGLEKKTLGG